MRKAITDNPFYVLGLTPACTRADVESEGQKLLGMLSLGLSAATTYATPLGLYERTDENVRAAMAELRDPDRRLRHELTARLAPAVVPEPAARDDARGAPWPDALAALGWRMPP
jgi:hypothetical protein